MEQATQYTLKPTLRLLIVVVVTELFAFHPLNAQTQTDLGHARAATIAANAISGGSAHAIAESRPQFIKMVAYARKLSPEKAAEFFDSVMAPKLTSLAATLEAHQAKRLEEHFSTGELIQVTTFFTSETGQKLAGNHDFTDVESPSGIYPLMRSLMGIFGPEFHNKAEPGSSVP